MSARPHPVFALLNDKTALQSNPELIQILGGSRTDAQVLMQLAYASAEFANPEGWFMYLQDRLGNQLGISERTLRRAIRRLELICLETRQEVISRNPRRTLNHYRIDWERLEERICNCHARMAAEAQQGDGSTTALAVKMTGNKINTTAASAPPRSAGRHSSSPDWNSQSAEPSGWSAKSSTRGDKAMDGYFAREAGRQYAIGEVSDLKNYGYDDRFNPPNARLPELGEPEAMACSKFSDIPPWVMRWLRTKALKQPVQDLEIALEKAHPEWPAVMVFIAQNIARGRRNARRWRKSA